MFPWGDALQALQSLLSSCDQGSVSRWKIAMMAVCVSTLNDVVWCLWLGELRAQSGFRFDTVYLWYAIILS